MFEATKTRANWPEGFAATYLSGTVLDIGCCEDLVVLPAQPFDRDHGDANRILDQLAPEGFDCVHSSHCLEHMHDPVAALSQWCALVKPGVTVITIVRTRISTNRATGPRYSTTRPPSTSTNRPPCPPSPTTCAR